jgi:excisionase family DNA binding protein
VGIPQAAELVAVSDDTVRRWIDNGALSASQDDAGRNNA